MVNPSFPLADAITWKKVFMRKHIHVCQHSHDCTATKQKSRLWPGPSIPTVIATRQPTCRGNTDDAVLALVRQHVPASTLSSRGGTELAFKLPRDESSSFAPLLSELEGRKAELGVVSCGLSVTTLEEVFLKVSAGSTAALDQKQAATYSQPQPVSAD